MFSDFYLIVCNQNPWKDVSVIVFFEFASMDDFSSKIKKKIKGDRDFNHYVLCFIICSASDCKDGCL